MVGAGAAGLLAAIFARMSGRPVVVLEKTADGGRKILVSGGGRCNVLPATLQPERFVTESPPHVLRHLLRSWPLAHQRAFFERDVGIPLRLEPDTGKFFPVSDRARDVRDGLIAHARRCGVEFRFNTPFESLEQLDRGWRVRAPTASFDADAVVIATGGLSVPKTGSDGAGLAVARDLGLAVHETYPALTPITGAPAVFTALAGLSLPVRVRARWREKTADASGGFLFTHHGYSGPAVLDLSHVAVRSRLAGEHAALRVSWTLRTAGEWREDFASHAGLVRTLVSHRLPQRLADALLALAHVPADRRASQLSRAERTSLVDALTACELAWTGDEGYAKAEVTGGGVALDELDRRTLESRRAPGVYFCGEVLDAFGPIGGHNFAWAWATGRLAGLGAGEHAGP